MARGHEQKGPRLAVVLQSTEFWPASTLVVVPTSMSASPRRFRPVVKIGELETTVLVDQIAAFDLDRFGDRVGSLSRVSLAAIDDAVIRFLGLSGRFRQRERVRS